MKLAQKKETKGRLVNNTDNLIKRLRGPFLSYHDEIWQRFFSCNKLTSRKDLQTDIVIMNATKDCKRAGYINWVTLLLMQMNYRVFTEKLLAFDTDNKNHFMEMFVTRHFIKRA